MDPILTVEAGIAVTEELNMLQNLLEEEQFEPAEPFLPAESFLPEASLRVIYMMNDAAESFLVFRKCRMTGSLLGNYEGPLTGRISRRDRDYVFVLYQGENVVTFFYESLQKEVHLYNYARLGHFWVKGYEYLRQFEYHLAILRDKRDYLGWEYCNEEELKLAYLTEFPPLNYCSYPAASPDYVIPAYPRQQVSLEAFAVIEELAAEAGDRKMLRMLACYRRLTSMRKTGRAGRGSLQKAGETDSPVRTAGTGFLASGLAADHLTKRLAAAFHREEHRPLMDLLLRKMELAAGEYPNRAFGEVEQELQKQLQDRADRRIRELQKAGREVSLFYEEPFTTSRDAVDFKIHLMIWDSRKGDRITEIETEEIL